MKKNKGFTLIELMIVVALIGIIISLVGGLCQRVDCDNGNVEACRKLESSSYNAAPARPPVSVAPVCNKRLKCYRENETPASDCEQKSIVSVNNVAQVCCLTCQ